MVNIEEDITALYWAAIGATSTEKLWSAFVDFCLRRGFLHIRLSVFPLYGKIEPKNFLLVLTRDATGKGWAQHYLNKRMYEYDQSVHLVRRKGLPAMRWTAMERETRKGSKANQVFKEMRDFGIGEGLLVPHSSLITKHTAFVGTAGPADVLVPFGRKALKAYIWTVQVVIGRLIYLAKKEGLLDGQEAALIKLTPGEREVVLDICNGRVAEEIAKDRKTTPGAVYKHLERAKDKLGVRTLPALVAACFRRQLIE